MPQKHSMAITQQALGVLTMCQGREGPKPHTLSSPDPGRVTQPEEPSQYVMTIMPMLPRTAVFTVKRYHFNRLEACNSGALKIVTMLCHHQHYLHPQSFYTFPN